MAREDVVSAQHKLQKKEDCTPSAQWLSCQLHFEMLLPNSDKKLTMLVATMKSKKEEKDSLVVIFYESAGMSQLPENSLQKV